MATISIRWAARRKPRMAVAGALLLGLTLAGPAGVEATFPGRNGPLVFMRDDEHGFPQIWTSRSDLTAPAAAHESRRDQRLACLVP